jgi:hypothetical protein
VRLTIRLEDDLYAIARSLARTGDCSISVAVNKLLRRGLESREPGSVRRRRGGLPVVRCPKSFTSEAVYALDAEPS